MLAVAFTSLGALSIVIDRSLFHTFLYTGANIEELLAWRKVDDTRVKLMLIEGMTLLKSILRYDALADIKILLSDHADRLLEDKIFPSDAILVDTWQIQKLTCQQINNSLAAIPYGVPASLLPKKAHEGSTEGSLLAAMANGFVRVYGSQTAEAKSWRKIKLERQPAEIKRQICEWVVFVSEFPWPVTKEMTKFIKRRDRLFNAYIYVYKYGYNVEHAATAAKIPKEDLFYILKFVPVTLGRVFLKALPSLPSH